MKLTIAQRCALERARDGELTRTTPPDWRCADRRGRPYASATMQSLWSRGLVDIAKGEGRAHVVVITDLGREALEP